MLEQQILPPSALLAAAPPVTNADDEQDFQVGAARLPAPNRQQKRAHAGGPAILPAGHSGLRPRADRHQGGPRGAIHRPVWQPAQCHRARGRTTKTRRHVAKSRRRSKRQDNAIDDKNTENQAASPASPAASPVVTDAGGAPSLSNIAAPTQGPTVKDDQPTTAGDVENDTAQDEHAKSRASATAVQNAAPRSAAAQASLTNPGQGEAAANSDIAKNRLIQAGANGAGKVETEKSDGAGDNVPKVAQQADQQNTAAKAAPQPAPAAIDAINTIAAPQAQTSPVVAAQPASTSR